MEQSITREECEEASFEDKGEIVAFERGERPVDTHWSPLSGKPDTPEIYHTVTWELAKVDDGTVLTLTRDNPTEEARDRSQENGEMILGKLKELLEP